MKTKVFGQVAQVDYIVNNNQKEVERNNGEIEVIFVKAPEIEERESIKEYREICSFDGELRYNRGTFENDLGMWGRIVLRSSINIAQDKEVFIDKEVFRADLGELHVFTNEVIERIEAGKEDAEAAFDHVLRDFNREMIMSNDKLKAYCDIHKLNYEDTDAKELFRLVYPGESYEIEDGKMKVTEHYKKVYLSSCDTSTATNHYGFENGSAIKSLYSF